jgi:capsular polysaccharide biosynthesis protein
MDPESLIFPNATIILGHQLFVSNYKGVIELDNHLLALDREGRPIPHTYLGAIQGDSTPFPPSVSGCINGMDAGFLLYSTPWHTNFQHFLVETFPKIFDYLDWIRAHGRVIPLLMPHYMMNALVQEIVEILGLQDYITLLEGPSTTYVKELVSSSYVLNYDPPTPRLIRAFKQLRDATQKSYPLLSPDRPRKIYLARETSPNPAMNNSNAGTKRVITNEDVLKSMLHDRGFEDVFVGNLRIAEKTRTLAGAEVIVSPLGANLMNLLFLTPPYPRRVIILHSDHLKWHAMYQKELINQIYDGRIAVDTLGGAAEDETENSPFAIEPNSFRHLLRCLIDEWGSRMFFIPQPEV